MPLKYFRNETWFPHFCSGRGQETGLKRFFLLQVIAAEGEQKASRALREAADVISQSPSALQVKPVNLHMW
jgi:hypothetical protein